MAEKKTTKAAAAKTAAPKEETKKVAAKKPAAKKPAAKKAEAKVEVVLTSENVGFKAGDVYQALAKAEKGLSVAQIAKLANISEQETLLGLGWLFKEGKVKNADNLIVLA